MLDKLAEYRKAGAALVVPALFLFGAALLPDTPGGSDVTAYEWVGIAIAGITGSVSVWRVPNEPAAKGKHEADA